MAGELTSLRVLQKHFGVDDDDTAMGHGKLGYAVRGHVQGHAVGAVPGSGAPWRRREGEGGRERGCGY
jgi:hypothetical protein